MFDNLRDTLSRFRDDVEESAEVEELDDSEEIAEGEADAEGEAVAEGEEGDAVEDDEPSPGEESAIETDTIEGVNATTGIEPPAEERQEGSGEATDDDVSDQDEVASHRDEGAFVQNEGSSVEKSGTELEDAEWIIQSGARTDDGGDGADGAEPDIEGIEDAGEGVEDADEGVEDAGEEMEGGDGEESPGFGQRARSLVRGRVVIDEEDLEDPLWELEMALLQSDVEMNAAEEILDGVREELTGETRRMLGSTTSVVEDALRESLLDVIDVGGIDFDAAIEDAEKPVVIIFTGVNGVGKTTSIAKLSRYLEKRGYSTVLANGDTYRAGANEQLAEHADALGKRLISHEQGGDPAAVIYDAVEYAKAHDVDVVLGDTAGRLHTSEGLMDQLAKIDRVVGPDMTLFVDEAVAGQDAVSRAREFNRTAEIDGAILTKADADADGGAAISIAHVTGKPILFLGTGQGYDDLVKFEPEEMVERLLGAE